MQQLIRRADSKCKSTARLSLEDNAFLETRERERIEGKEKTSADVPGQAFYGQAFNPVVGDRRGGGRGGARGGPPPRMPMPGLARLPVHCPVQGLMLPHVRCWHGMAPAMMPPHASASRAAATSHARTTADRRPNAATDAAKATATLQPRSPVHQCTNTASADHGYNCC